MTGLLTALRELPDAPERAAQSVDDWNALLDASDVHGLTSLVHHALAAHVPAESRVRLERETQASTARALRLKRLLTFVLEGFSGLGVVPVVLKGIGLGLRIWPEWHLRPSGDVDVLVEPERAAACGQWLEAQGFASHEDPGEDDVHAHHHHVGYAGQRGLVEVHFRALAGPGGGALEGSDLFARTLAGEIDGRPVRWLPVEEELVYLASHAAQHLFQRISWLYDLKLFLRQHRDLSWNRVADVAAAAHLRSATHSALVLARDELAADVPEAALAALAPSRAHHRAVRAAFTAERLTHATLARSRLAPALRALISDSPMRAARHLLEGAARRTRRGLRRAQGK